MELENAGDETIRDGLDVLHPKWTILRCHALLVAQTPVDDHGSKENEIEVKDIAELIANAADL